MAPAKRRSQTSAAKPAKATRAGSAAPVDVVEPDDLGDIDPRPAGLHDEVSHEIGSQDPVESPGAAADPGDILPEFREQVLSMYANERRWESASVDAPVRREGLDPVDAWYGSYGTRLSRVFASHGGEMRVAEMMAEVIISRDDRIRVRETTRYPYGCICQLSIQARNGGRFVGTGWLADEQTVITAGHCVFMRREGGWAASIAVFPGRDGAARPFHARATRLWTTRGWMDHQSPPADYGAIRLDRKIDALGTFGYGALKDSQLQSVVCHVVGYPSDKGGEMWGHGRRLAAVRTELLIYDVDTYGGNSGGPVFLVRDGKPLAVGIHNYGDLSGNSATRITKTVYQRIQGWVEA